MQVKDNQKELAAQIKHGCRIEKPLSIHEDEWSKQHGRLEQRTYEVFSAKKMLKKWQPEWPYIRHVIRVTRSREILKKGSKPTVDVSYYATNAPNFEAGIYAKLIRDHWRIENTSHYVRDVSFLEDSGIRHVNPGIFSRLITCAYNTLSGSKITKFKECIYKNTLSMDHLMNNVKNF